MEINGPTQGCDGNYAELPKISKSEVGTQMLLNLITDPYRRNLAEFTSRKIINPPDHLSPTQTTKSVITPWFITMFSCDLERGFLELIGNLTFTSETRKYILDTFLSHLRSISLAISDNDNFLEYENRRTPYLGRTNMYEKTNTAINIILEIMYDLSDSVNLEA
ncbi:MAG: hypothetical protein ABI721_00200 [Candidatus Dojkabacteria bacterium]